MQRFLNKGEIRASQSLVMQRELRALLEGHDSDVLHALGTIERACVWLVECRGWSEKEVGSLVAYAASLLGRPGMAATVVRDDAERKDLGLGYTEARYLESSGGADAPGG